MNLNQLYYFQTLAKYQHYTKASQELFIAQPSLTYAIKELEKELGTELFIKKGRNVYLSENGKVFLSYVNKSLKTLNEGILKVQNIKKTQQKKIEICVIPTIINTYLMPILKTLSKEHPEIDIHFRSDRTVDIIDGVKKNIYDFGICSKVDDPSLSFLPLLTEELVLITAKDHPLSQKKKIRLEDIIEYPVITYHHDIPIFKSVNDLFEKNNLKPNIRYGLDDETSIASMVSLDFGVGIVANNVNLKPFDSIEVIHLDIKQDSRIIYIVYNSNIELSLPAQNFIDYLIDNHYELSCNE